MKNGTSNYGLQLSTNSVHKLIADKLTKGVNRELTAEITGVNIRKICQERQLFQTVNLL